MAGQITDEHQIDENMHELVSHGKVEFPVAFYGDAYKFLGSKSFYAHWHAEVEVTIAVKGDIEVSCNDEIITIKEGDALFINSNILHCLIHDNYPDSICETIVFNPIIIYGYHNSAIETKYVLPIINGNAPYIYISHDSDDEVWGKRCVESYMNAIKFFKTKKDGYELGIKIMLCDAWYTMYKNVPRSDIVGSAFSSKVLLVKNAVNFIHNNYPHDITLDDIAHSSLLSKSELCKLFKKYINHSPIQYLLKHRISKACYYLVYTNDSITDISNKVGIYDPNYFAISFKKLMNITPTEYRKNGLKNKEKIELSEYKDIG